MTTSTIASLIAGFWLSTAAAFAQTDTNLSAVENLGTILGSESACGVTLDTTAIKQWIGANVSAEDMTFTDYLGMYTRVTQRSFKDMSPTLKEAHCTQVKRVVEKLKLGH